MFEEVESNICQIISHCLHESIQNKDKNPSFISSDNIIQYFPDKLNIQRFDIIEKSHGLWTIKNNQIDCNFGLKIITNNNNTKSWILNIINSNNNTQNINNNNNLFIQPSIIHNGFISKSIQFEWAKLDHINNDYKQSGIKCRFNVMNQTHQFGVIPFVKCNHINLGQNQQNDENQPVLCSGPDQNEHNETNYDDWYAEQYLDFYGYYDREKEEKQKSQSQNVLQSIIMNQNQIQCEQHQHYGHAQNGHDYDHAEKKQMEQEQDEDEDIDLNYKCNQMNTSMNNRRERERKRLFRHFENQNHDGLNQYNPNNPNKKRKFNHCMNRNNQTLYQS